MLMKEGTLSSYGYGVNYATWGDRGPLVLIIHSMGMDAHSMNLLAESLGETHRILRRARSGLQHTLKLPYYVI